MVSGSGIGGGETTRPDPNATEWEFRTSVLMVSGSSVEDDVRVVRTERPQGVAEEHLQGLIGSGYVLVSRGLPGGAEREVVMVGWHNIRTVSVKYRRRVGGGGAAEWKNGPPSFR